MQPRATRLFRAMKIAPFASFAPLALVTTLDVGCAQPTETRDEGTIEDALFAPDGYTQGYGYGYGHAHGPRCGHEPPAPFDKGCYDRGPNCGNGPDPSR